MTYRKWGPDWRSDRDSTSPEVEIVWEWACGGYEWWGAALLRRTLSDERVEYAAYWDSGCSCNYMYEGSPVNIAWNDNPKVVLTELSNHMNKIPSFYGASIDKILDAKASAREAWNRMLEES